MAPAGLNDELNGNGLYPSVPSRYRKQMRIRTTILATAATLAVSTPALAEVPAPVRAMIDAAIATGDAKKVDTVIALAKQTNPADADEIDALQAAFRADQTHAANLAKKRQELQIRNASVFDRWKGKGQLGGSRSTGNSDTIGISAAIDLKRTGIDWTHHIAASVDYQRSGGVTTRERYNALYEPHYDIRDNFFAYGLAQFERDQFQGFDARYSTSLGIGYQLIKSNDMNLSVKAGPALRRTEYTAGGGETRLAALLGYDFDWKLADSLKFTQSSNVVADGASSGTVILDSSTTTVAINTGLEAKITPKFSTQFSYQINYDSNPPVGAEKTDTISRVTLVYGF